MTTIMDMNSGKALFEPEEYGDEVLNANWLPLQAQPALQTVEVEHAAPELPPAPVDVDSFLQAVYRYQE